MNPHIRRAALRIATTAAAALALAACGTDPGPIGTHDVHHGEASVDTGVVDMDSGVVDDNDFTPDIVTIDTFVPVPDVPLVDGSGAYDTPPVGDVMTGCDAGTCMPHADNCAATEVCANGTDNTGNGLDDNCNGMVDEGCQCLPGDVHPCFQGPPGRRGVGACSDGTQTCQDNGGEFGVWGACMGGIAPSGETCDHLDNDCNGCADEGLCCTAPGSCPGPGDPRIPTGRPFSTLTLNGSDFLMGGTMYHWHVVGGPCDQMLWATSQHVSYKLNGSMQDTLDATGPMLTFAPQLSGDYTVTLAITRADGSTFTCTFIVPVRAPGFRAELCWDTSGTDDIDLWVHRPGTTTNWPTDNTNPPDTCYYANCKNRDVDITPPRAAWGYTATPGGACRQPAAGNICRNPRLDVDNVGDLPGTPENINVDAPNNNDRFRVAAHYYGGGANTPSGNETVHPMVNIYCGGRLQATYGGANVGMMHFGSALVGSFNTGGNGDSSGSLWRVADVTMHEPADTCTLHPIHPGATPTMGYCVKNDGNRTYGDGCVAP